VLTKKNSSKAGPAFMNFSGVPSRVNRACTAQMEEHLRVALTGSHLIESFNAVFLVSIFLVLEMKLFQSSRM
jgi:hypothetical protein